MTQAEYKHAPRNSGRRKLMVLTSMVLLLCLACFALGVMVGSSGLKAQNEKGQPASAASADMSTPTPAPVRISPAGQAADVQALKPEVQEAAAGGKAAAQTEEVDGVNREAAAARVAAAVEAALIEKPVVRETPLGSGINLRQKSGAGAASAADALGSDASPSAAKAEEKAVVATASSASKVAAKGDNGEGYVVQIAAFRRDADAQRLAQKLKADFPVYVHQVNLADKGQWFRVLVGPVAKRTEADTLRQKVKEKAGIEGFVKKHSTS